MPRISLLAAFTLALLWCTHAYADDKADFVKYISNPTEQQHVIDAAKRSMVVTSNACPTAVFTLLNQIAVYQPTKFDSAGNILAGAWKQSVSEKGCGAERQLNVFLVVDSKEKTLKMIPVFPGTTRADPILQKDSVQYVVMAAVRPEDKECKVQYISDTAFLMEKGEALPGAKGKPWDELWTMVICAKKAQVTMHFIPDKTGTTIQTSLQETRFSTDK